MEEGAKTAVIVDDELFFAARILAGLLKLGWRAERACTPSQAVELIEEIHPDIVIVNLGSRKYDGIDAVRRVRAAGPAVRLITFLNHTAIPSVREKALAAGADAIYPNSSVSMKLPDIVSRVMSSTR